MPKCNRRIRTASENATGRGPFARLVFLARQEGVREAAGHVCMLGAAAAAALLLAVALDHAVVGGLSAAARTAVLVAGVAGVLVAAGVVAVRFFSRRVSLTYIARRLEQAGDIRHNALVNAVLVDTMDAGSYARPAAFEQAAVAIARAPHQLPVGRGAWRPLLLAAAVLVLWVLYATVVPKSVGASLLRLLGADLPAPTATRIKLVRPAAGEVVRANAALELEFELTGAPIDDVTLAVSDAAGELQSGESIAPARRLRSPEGVDRRIFALAPFQVQSDIAYRCKAGDAVLEGVIAVHPMPRLDALEIMLTPPAYTQRPPHAETERDFSVPAGTHATFRLVANTPLKQAVFVFEESARESRTRLRVESGNPRVATLDHPLLAGGAYRFEITDDAGLTTPTDAAGRITVRPDEPPRFLGVREVGSLAGEPFVQSIVAAGAWPLLDAAATDDVAIERAWFVVQVATAVERTPVAVVPGETDQIVILSVDLNDVIGPEVRTATAWFEAQDGRVLPDGRASPQTTLSPAIQLTREPPASPPSQRAESQPDPRARETMPPVNADGPEPSTQPTQDMPSDEPADEGAAAPGQTGDPANAEPPIEQAVDEFIRDHGQEAAEAERVRRARSGESQQSGEASSPPLEQTPGESESPGQPADGPAPEGHDGGEPGQQPGGDAPEPGGEGRGAPADQAKQDGEKAPGEGEHSNAGDGSAAGEGSASGEGTAEPGDSSDGTMDSGRQSPADKPAPDESEPAAGGNSQPKPGDAEPGAHAAGSTPGGGDAAGDAVADLIEAAERGEEFTPDDLVRAGWPQAKADAFIRNLTHLRERLRQAGGVEILRKRIERAGGAVPAVRRGAVRADDAVQVSTEETWEDRLRALAPPAGEHVPDDLRAVLEAYYRAVAERATRDLTK